jgi:hypothetical protein
MTQYNRLIDKRWLAIGKPLPFSIYDAHRKLLLAQGHIVESERSLQRLLDHGTWYKAESSPASWELDEESADGDPVDPLTALVRDYSNITQRAHCGVKIAPKETGESHLCWVIGVAHHNRCLVMTAPVRPDRTLASISKGQVWFCRAFGSTTVLRFRGAIQKVAYDPYPYLHILVPAVIETQLIRQLPRALVSVPATLAAPEAHEVTIVDLGVGGARIGADKRLQLEAGASVQLVTTIELQGRTQELRLQARVATVHGVADGRHPSIAFYGLSFEALDESLLLELHGYVQQRLAIEHDGLAQLLALGTVRTE